uniref:Uncharacterized protein n=1 Tax=Anguilla anguilla TaxID=7936 RepID=A0A0E9QSP2_ANGAN
MASVHKMAEKLNSAFHGVFQSPKTYIRHNHVIAYAEYLTCPC